MTVPKYIQDLLSRSWWDFSCPESVPGYSIAIAKSSIWGRSDTLRREVEHFCRWADSHTPEGLTKSAVVSMPDRTHYQSQFAVVTVYDPVMRLIEPLVNGSRLDAELNVRL